MVRVRCIDDHDDEQYDVKTQAEEDKICIYQRQYHGYKFGYYYTQQIEQGS
jgi:hypothetical protein